MFYCCCVAASQGGLKKWFCAEQLTHKNGLAIKQLSSSLSVRGI